MIIQVKSKDIMLNFAARILKSGASFVVLPIILTHLSPAEMGIWYVFTAISALANLFDCGFSPTFSRNITYAMSGAKELVREGISHQSVLNKPNYGLMKAFLKASFSVYSIITSILLLSLVSLGTLYFHSLLDVQKGIYYIAWGTFLVSICEMIFRGRWSAFLAAVGGVKEVGQSILLSKLLYLACVVIGIKSGGGLIALTLATLISGIVERSICKIVFFYKLGKKNISFADSSEYKTKDIVGIVFPNAKKTALISVSTFLITNISALYCATFLGLEINARYGLTCQCLAFINSIANIVFLSLNPMIAECKVRNEKEQLVHLFAFSAVCQWFITIAGIVALCMFGPGLLKLVGSGTTLLPVGFIIGLGIVNFLECNASVFTSFISTGNTIPYLKSYLISGISVSAITFFLLKWSGLGIVGIIITNILVQGSYNYWYWVIYVLRDLDISLVKFYKIGISMIIKKSMGRR